MRRFRKWGSLILLVLGLLLLGISANAEAMKGKKTFLSEKRITAGMLDKMDFRGVENLMIVAHPDDETLWGGGHLLKEKYLVVCLTNAKTKKYGTRRARELKKVLQKTGDLGIILNYPDYKKGTHRTDNWASSRNSIAKDISTLLRYKRWKKVVTHNPKGEYGHIHHKKTSSIVTDCFRKGAPADSQLYYFGSCYSSRNAKQLKKFQAMDRNTLKKKKQLLKNYKSQSVKKFAQMYPYENWSLAR